MTITRLPLYPANCLAAKRSLPRLLMTFMALLATGLLAALPQTARAHDPTGKPVDVTLSGQVTAPGEVTLNTVILPGVDASLLHLQWTLADGGELLDGPAGREWRGVAAFVPQQETRRVRVPGAGVYQVAVGARIDDGAGGGGIDGAVLFVVSDGSAIALYTRDPRQAEARGSLMPMTVESAVTAAAPATPDDDPCYSITGRILREEHTPVNGGYQPMVRVPVRAALVEIREEDDFFDDSYGTTLTNEQGYYAFIFCADDGIFDDDLELYVRLTAELRSQNRKVVEVQEDGFIPNEAVYYFDSPLVEPGTPGGPYTINFNLNREQSAVFNIADAILDAFTVWNANGGAVGGDLVFDYTAEVNWEDSDDDEKTFYMGYISDEITIADAPGNPDEWDDPAIIHEWTHQADDNYGCDDSPGGPHSSDDPAQDLELAWDEGFATYYQSSVRKAMNRTDAGYYLDGLGPDNPVMFGYDLETRDLYTPTINTDRNESKIAAMLWDLEDSGLDTNDGQDRTGVGRAVLQQVFTDPLFAENGDVFDDTCTTSVYLQAWVQSGKPATAEIGAIVQQNIGRSLQSITGLAAANAVVGAGATQDAQPAPDDYRWWKNLTWVVDTSASMAASGKLAAVKTVMLEQVNDLAAAAKGTEFNLFTFNNAGATLSQPVGQKFFAEFITPAVNALTTIAAADGDCTVEALRAMAQAAQLQKGGDIWLYTDRSTSLFPLSIEATRQLLNQRQIRGSFAMLGGCAGTLPARMSDVSGGEQSYLGSAANGSQSTGIVPYLLTALGSGGQFLHVREDQLTSAADILRAQVANSAGAGKWSDYVSDQFTYRWDRLEAGEYQWLDLLPPLTGDDRGQFDNAGNVTYELPVPFNFYGINVTSVRVSLDGLVELNPCTVLCPSEKLFLESLRGGTTWDGYFPPALAAAANEPAAVDGAAPGNECSGFLPANGWFAEAYSLEHDGQWHVISTHGCAGADPTIQRKYQIWLNTVTGEIRYLYETLSGEEAAGARIGVRATSAGFGLPERAVVVSDNDVAGASSGMGYKFTPAPPQPTRVYTVAVDSFMESVGFLQTGYSGAFEPMVVRDPNGVPVDCGDTANVLCLTMNNVGTDRLVQYVQVNLNGVIGDWSAAVDAQAGAEGTFTFSALATSSIEASTLGQRSLPSAGAVRISVRLPMAADGNILTAWLQQPNGQRLGSDFQLFDDGLHGDGRAGDGYFSVADYPAQGQGAAYLWVQGALGGAAFVRSDPTPFNFQPVEVLLLVEEMPFVGGVVALPVRITNHDSVVQCFDYGATATVPEGWSYQWSLPPGDDGSEQLFGVCIGAGETIDRELLVTPSQFFFDGASGAAGVVGVAFIEQQRRAIAGTDSATVVRRREGATIEVTNPLGQNALRPNGIDTATLVVRLFDDTGMPVVDGTPVNLTTDLGSLTADGATGQALTAGTADGKVELLFTADAVEGDATVTAEAGGLVDSTAVYLRQAGGASLALTAGTLDLAGSNTTTELVATVLDDWGDPVTGAALRIGVSDDSATQGVIDGGQVVTGTTDGSGQFSASFTKIAGSSGPVDVRAELFVNDEGAERIVATDSETLQLSPVQRRVYLPLAAR